MITSHSHKRIGLLQSTPAFSPPYRFFYTFLLSFLIGFAGCSKSDEEPLPVVSSAFSGMKATIGNKSWQADSVAAVLDNGKFILNGSTAHSKFTITTGGALKGKYPVYAVTFSSASFTDSTTSYKSYDTEVDEQYGGLIEISQIDTVNLVVSGTFKFSMRSLSDGKLISIEDGRFSMKYRVTSPDDDTTVNNHGGLNGVLRYFGSSGNTQQDLTLNDGKIKLLGSRIVAEYTLSPSRSLRIEVEQRTPEGTVFFPTLADNAKGAVQLIVNGVVYHSETGRVSIDTYNQETKEMKLSLDIQFESDNSGGHFELTTTAEFKHP
ncbi:MAG: DUF6252 family protein [Bacteroidota bacterium]